MNYQVNAKHCLEILLVEDNPADAQLFQRGMRGAHHITVAQTGAEALDRLSQRGKFQNNVRPDIVVADLNLPIMSGHEVIKAIKSNPSLRSIPIIVLSSSSRSDDVQGAYDLGACAYLVKSETLPDANRTLSAFAGFWIEHVVYPNDKR